MAPAAHPAVDPRAGETAFYAAKTGLAAGSERLIPLLRTTARHLATGTLCLGAGIIMARRLAGGLVGPLPLGGLLVVAWAGIGLIIIVDRATVVGTKPSSWLSRAGLLVILVMLGVWFPMSRGETIVTVVLLITVTGLLALPPMRWLPAGLISHLQRDRWLKNSYGEQAETGPVGVNWIRNRVANWRLGQSSRTNPLASPSLAYPTGYPPHHIQNHSTAFDGQLLQWQERYRTTDGREFLRGQVIVQLAAGTRLATGHVGFCPAFAATPTVEVFTEYDALEVVVEAAEILPWGIRVECRVEDTADEPVGIPIELTVSLPASSSSTFPLSSSPTDLPDGTLA